MSLHYLLEARFPVDMLVLLGVALVSGAGWTVGAWLMGKGLR